jgi:hypothetical protein
LPDPIAPASPRPFCELADGHEDAHVAFAFEVYDMPGFEWNGHVASLPGMGKRG